MKRLRDGLYGQGPFARWAKQYPPQLEVNRAVGLVAGLARRRRHRPARLADERDGQKAGCATKLGNLYVIKYADIRAQMKTLLEQGFGFPEGPRLGAPAQRRSRTSITW